MNTTESNLLNVCSAMGLSIQLSSGLFQTDSKGWEHIAFQSVLSCNGKQVWAGPYKLGIGHVKLLKASSLASTLYTMQEERIIEMLERKPNTKFLPEFQTVKAKLFQRLANKQNVTPQLADVVHSLLSDGSAFFDGESFDKWCANFGCDTDSRKAEATWKACLEIGMTLRKAFSVAEIETLREAAQDF